MDRGDQVSVFVLVLKLAPCIQRARRAETKRQTTTDWQVADLISKGTYTGGLFQAATRRVDFYPSPPES